MLARPHIDARLEPGESVRGIAAATLQKTFSGGLYAVGVTDRRLVLQPLGRKFDAKGEPVVLLPESIEKAELDGAGDGWWTAPSAVLDAAALTLRLRTRQGDRLKLLMMKGGGGLLGGLGGGESQQQGVLALAEWLGANVRR